MSEANASPQAIFDAWEVPAFHLDDLSVDTSYLPPSRPVSRRAGQGSANALRIELNHRAKLFAHTHSLLHDTTPGSSPSVIFGQDASGAHGNFFPPSYRAILAESGWAARLRKPHTAHRRSRARAEWRWSELDAASSSDALLMNIFCCPGIGEGSQGARFRALLGIPAGLHPEFGYHPCIPLHNGRFDRTEIDLRLGGLLLEAKLTEGSFQTARPALVERYRDVQEIFDPILYCQPTVAAYQLVRGVLAAFAEPSIPPAAFCVLADARRPDLLDAWYAVLRMVRPHDLRCRLQMLTWQELTTTLPTPLQSFLEEKYGILPA